MGNILKRKGVIVSPENIQIENGIKKGIKVNLYKSISKQVRINPVKKAVVKKMFSTVMPSAFKIDLVFAKAWIIGFNKKLLQVVNITSSNDKAESFNYMLPRVTLLLNPR